MRKIIHSTFGAMICWSISNVKFCVANFEMGKQTISAGSYESVECRPLSRLSVKREIMWATSLKNSQLWGKDIYHHIDIDFCVYTVHASLEFTLHPYQLSRYQSWNSRCTSCRIALLKPLNVNVTVTVHVLASTKCNRQRPPLRSEVCHFL